MAAPTTHPYIVEFYPHVPHEDDAPLWVVEVKATGAMDAQEIAATQAAKLNITHPYVVARRKRRAA